MPSRKQQVATADPTVLFFTLPPILILGVYLIRKWYLARRLRVHGIGKGAPGFQTSVRKIRVTPEIAERLARGENVSPDEIAAASAKADAEEEKKGGARKKAKAASKPKAGGLLAGRGVVEEIQLQPNDSKSPPSPAGSPQESSTKVEVNEWLPEHLTAPKKRPGKGRRK